MNYFIRAFTGITIPTLALYFYNRDDERWDQIPKDIRRMNWIIFYGEEEDDYLTIPKPFETGFFWASWFEEVLDYMYDNDMEEFAEGIRWLILETFAIDVIPQALKPFDELRINEKWTGAPIVPPYLDGVEASEQYKHYTSDAMVALARVLSDKLGYEVSPMMAQHVVEGYLGTMGQYGLSVADFFVQDMTNGGQEIAGPHRELDDEELFEAWGKKYYSDLPWDIGDALLLDRFIDHGPLRRTQQQKEFYELLREARTTASTVRLMQLRDPERLRAYLQQVDEAFYYGASADINSLAQQLNQIDQTIERVATNPQMSPIAKRQLIETYTRQRNLALKALSEKLDVDKYEEAMEVLNRMSPPPPDQEPPLN